MRSDAGLAAASKGSEGRVSPPKLPGELPLQASSAVAMSQVDYNQIIPLLSILYVLDCCSSLSSS